MATIRPIGKKWRADVKRAGVRKSRTFKIKNDATLWAIEQEKILDSSDGSYVAGYSLSDCFDRYAKEESPKKRGERWERMRLQKLARSSLGNVVASDLRLSDVERWRDESLETLSPASVNREINLLLSVVKQAVKWRWIPVYPLTGLERPPPTKSRRRRISDAEIAAMLSALDINPDDVQIFKRKHEVGVIFLLAIETACRLGELCALEWRDVHLTKRYIHLPETKNGDARDVPLTKFAVYLFSRLTPKPAGKVFHISSGTASTMFRRYRIKAGVENLHMHDTRHEGVSRLAKKLTMMELAKMVGHRDPRSLMIYYEPSAEELAAKLD
jgi:integrase